MEISIWRWQNLSIGAKPFMHDHVSALYLFHICNLTAILATAAYGGIPTM